MIILLVIVALHHIDNVTLSTIIIVNKIGSGGGVVVKLLACGASGPEFESRSRRLDFTD